jgi:hypothetical protein
MKLLQETISCIRHLDAVYIALAQARLDSLTRPMGSLGKLEGIGDSRFLRDFSKCFNFIHTRKI